MSEKTVGIGIIGAGFLAETRARCYGQQSGVGRIRAVASRTEEKANDYAQRHSISKAFGGYEKLLELPEIDVVDLCIPNHLHRQVTEAAAAAGKHVVCTKPLTAYTGQDLPEGSDDADVSGQDRARMLEVATADAQSMVDATAKAGVQLMYGENWIYSPSIAKAAALIEKAGGTILEMRGGECHSGSHSPYAKIWRYSGGGSLLRLGAHPIGAMLYLKDKEGRTRDGRPIRAVSVTAEQADLSSISSVTKEKEQWIASGWQDVENWASVIITFEDGARGIAWASDGVLGGMESRLEVFLSNAHVKCNLSPNNLVQAFAPGPAVFADAYLMEKVETKAGWSTPIPDEDWSSGHFSMCRDFISAVAEGRPAQSDGELGVEVVRVVYGAYLAAAQGRRVNLRGS